MSEAERCLGSVRTSGEGWVDVWCRGEAPELGALALHPPAGSAVGLHWHGGWTLRGPLDGAAASLHLDFAAPTLRQRLLDTRSGQSPLAKAFGKLQRGVLWDLTAGLGRDSLSLAARGFEVRAVERDPVVHLLLCDARRRLAEQPMAWAAAVAERVEPVWAEAASWLVRQEQAPAAVLLDPMFAEEGRKSRVKKDLALLHQLVPSRAGDGAALAEVLGGWLAAREAETVVVVKRASGAPPLWARPSHSVASGGAARFDVHRGPWR